MAINKSNGDMPSGVLMAASYNWYGSCQTEAGIPHKVVNIPGYILVYGNEVVVEFVNDVYAGSTLDISNTGAMPILYRGHSVRDNDICAGDKVSLVYDGSSYNILSVDSINYSTDMDMRVTPLYCGQLEVGPGRMCQGMTSDCTYLYVASISTSDLVSSPMIHKINPSNMTTSSKTPKKKGHYNNLNYYNGYIYATGFNANDVNDDYSQIYKYNYSNNSGSIINTDEWYWNFAIGDGPYNSRFYIGHVGSRPAFSVYSTQKPNSMNFLPWTQCPTEYYNGIEQGCAIYDNKYICTVLTDLRTVTPGSTHSTHMIIVTNLTGKTVKRIRLMLPNGCNEELEDICFIGKSAYINSSTGKIFFIKDVTKLFRGFYENTYPIVWQKPCWMYINGNGTESWITGTYGGSSGRLLKSFKLCPLADSYEYKYSNATGMFVFRGKHFPIKVNPSSGNITVQIDAVIDNYEYVATLYYTLSSDRYNYIYTLTSIKGGYRNINGVLTVQNGTTASTIQACCNNMFYQSDSYIHHIISDDTVAYTYMPTCL